MTHCSHKARPTLLVKSGGAEAFPEWQRHFQECAPFIEARSWYDHEVEPQRVEYALVWQPERGRLASYRNLKLILSSAAGVDHITDDPDWPRHVPLLRASTVEAAQRMGEYVSMSALALLKNMPRLISQQRMRKWQPFDTERCATETNIGVLGIGNLGIHCAKMLAGLGFRVSGWSRTQKNLAGIECFVGESGLQHVLTRSNILVCLLPATAETEGILNRASFQRMPQGGCIINVARGAHIDHHDLLEALDSGHLGGAVLDVFEREPLPASNALWAHEKVIMTPHIASIASRRSRAQFFAEQILAQMNGAPLSGAFDPRRGY